MIDILLLLAFCISKYHQDKSMALQIYRFCRSLRNKYQRICDNC